MSLEKQSKQFGEIAKSDDVEWLQERLAACFSITIENVVEMAAIVRRLDELEEPYGIEFAALRYLRLIAHGNLSPELYCACDGNWLLLDKTRQLPNVDQQRIASNDPVKVMELGGDHSVTAPRELSVLQIRQVFGRGTMRSDAEQIGWLRERYDREQAKQRAKDQANREELPQIDRKRNGAVIHGFMTATDLANLLAQLNTPARR